MTPSSSSSFMSWSSPSVTATDAWQGLRPVAKALGAASGTTYSFGTGRFAFAARRSMTSYSLGACSRLTSCAPLDHSAILSEKKYAKALPIRAMINAMVMPLRPPKYAPMVTSTSVSAVNRNVVRRTLIGFPYHRIRKPMPSSRELVQAPSLSCLRPLSRSSRFLGLYSLETHGVALAIAVHANMIAGEHLAVQDLQRQRILHQSLNRASQRPGAVCWVVTFAHQQLLRRGREFKRDLAFRQQLFHSAQQQLHDALELLFAQRIEDHNFIDAIDELRAERGAQRFHRLFPSALGIAMRELENCRRAYVAGHHQDSVAKIHRAALAVR